MKGGIMNSQRAIAAAGYQPPALPFAQLPNPDSVLGRVYIASDVGPAPGIELIAAPGRWRPRGGRQVLAMRSNNPVTVQSLAGEVAETIGPFPGGFMRSGMRLEVKASFAFPAVGTAIRNYWFLCGNSIPITPGGAVNIIGPPYADNGTALSATLLSGISFMSDTSGHVIGPWDGLVGKGNALYSASSVDISLPVYFQVRMRSAAETAVNISSATWAGGIATINTSAAHTLAVGDKTVTAGVTPTGWNIPAGAIVLSVPTTTQFTVALAADPGTYSTGGTSSRISNVTSQSYVLELVG